MLKKFFKEYFSFSRKETYAAIVILFITALFIALPYLFSKQKQKEKLDDKIAALTNAKLQQKDSSNLAAETEDNPNDYSNYATNFNSKNNNSKIALNPFQFNPNTLDEAGFKKLGLADKLVKTIINYRNKGGKFYKPDDFRKIWGLKQEDADVLVKYIILDNATNAAKTYNKNQPATPLQRQAIDINTATANDLKALPSLGNMAYKIIKFRDKLGGFININQIKETYGMNDTLFQNILPFIKIISTNIQKLNINTASDFELSQHPYISNEVGKAIAIYRKQHGNYASIDDVKKIVFIKQDVFNKFAPYITVN